MELTPLQLEIQKLGADKSISFGCIIEHSFLHTKGMYINSMMRGKNDYIRHSILSRTDIIRIDDNIEIIGHPITYSRLMYLRSTNQSLSIPSGATRNAILVSFQSNPELYNQSILEWDSVTVNLVRDFLLSIQ